MPLSPRRRDDAYGGTQQEGVQEITRDDIDDALLAFLPESPTRSRRLWPPSVAAAAATNAFLRSLNRIKRSIRASARPGRNDSAWLVERTTPSAGVSAFGGPSAPLIRSTAVAWIGRVHAPALKSPLTSFVGGIVVGAVVMWFSLRPPVNPSSAHNQSASANSMPVLRQSGASAHQSSLPREDPPSEQSFGVAPVVAAVTTPETADLSSPRERRPAPPRPAAANLQSIARRQPAPPITSFRGTLAIASGPEGARVLVNGQPVGTTPLELKDVPVGSRAVRIEAAGYQTWSASVQVTANQRTKVMAKLDRVLADAPR